MCGEEVEEPLRHLLVPTPCSSVTVMLSQHLQPAASSPPSAYSPPHPHPTPTLLRSLYKCGAGIVADGRLLDLMRRLSTFDLALLKLDIRQESTR